MQPVDVATHLKDYLRYGTLALPEQRQMDEVAAEILRLHDANGGATFSLFFGNQAGTRSYSVSTFPERSVTLPGKEIVPEQMEGFLMDNADLLTDPRCCVGTWYDEEADETYVDVSVLLTRKREAISFSKQYNQIGLFDLWRMEYIPTGGTGQMVDDILPEQLRLAPLERT